MSLDFALLIYSQGTSTPALKDLRSPVLGGPVSMSKAATDAWALVWLLSAMFGMYRHAHWSAGAGYVMPSLWITSGQELLSRFLGYQNGGR